MEIFGAVRKIRKAVAAALAAAVVAGLNRWVKLDVGSVEAIINAVIISLVVWVVPNAKDEISG